MFVSCLPRLLIQLLPPNDEGYVDPYIAYALDKFFSLLVTLISSKYLILLSLQ
jgi:hypothetical protein